MRQSTLGFFLVPKMEAEDRENEDGEEEAGEEDAVEVSSSGGGSDESGAESDGDQRGIETTAPLLLPLAPLEENASQRRTMGSWSIPHHLKSRQIGTSRPRAKRPMVQSSSSPNDPSRRRPAFASASSTSFSTPARHRAAAASASARSLRPANASLPLVVETVASDAAFPTAVAATSGAERTTTAVTATAASLVRRRDWRVSDLRFDSRTGELLAVVLRGPGVFSPGDGGGPAQQHQGELQLFSDSSLRASLSARPFPTLRRRRPRGSREEEEEEEEGGGASEDEGDEDEGEDEPPRERTGATAPLATVRFPDGPLLELAWDCRCGGGGGGGQEAGGGTGTGAAGGGGGGGVGGSDVVAALVGGSRLSGGMPSSFSAASGSRRYPSGALALFDLDDEAIFCSSAAGGGERRRATAVIEPSSSSPSLSSSSSSSATLAFRSSAISLAAAAPSWTTLCPTTVSSAFAVGDAAGKVHLWDRRASLKRAVGMLSGSGGCGGGGGASSVSSSLRSLALLADGQTLVGGCSDGTLRLWDVRVCLGAGSGTGNEGGGSRGRAGVVSLGGGGRAGVVSLGGAALASRRCRTNDSAASHVGGALPAATGCLRSAVRAVPGVPAVLAGTPQNGFADAVALGGVSLLCPHPTDAARMAFRLDCGWSGAYVVGARGASGGEAGGGDGVGAVSHLHAPPVVGVGGEGAASSSSVDASSSPSARRLLLLRGGAWGSAASPASFVVNGTSSSCASYLGAEAVSTLAVVDCLNAGSAAAAGTNGNGGDGGQTPDPAAPPFPSAVHVPIPAEKAATAVAVHKASGEVVVGTEDGCLAWFEGCL